MWNRSAAKADALVAAGAVRAGSVAEAVAASPLIVVCVLDHEVAHRILEPVGAGLAGRVLVNLTSDNTPERSRRAFDTYEETLGTPGGRAPYLGADHGISAVYDLAMLSFFHSGMAGLAHAFTLAGAEGVTAKDLMGHLGVIVEIFPAIAEGMAAGHGGAEFVRTTETRRAPAV